MKVKKIFAGLLAVAFLASLGAVIVQAQSVFIPMFTYRTGPFAPNGSNFSNGFVDYLKLLQIRDGGIEGVKLIYEECEFGYNTGRGVECYERLKAKGSVISNPNSTGLSYKLIPKARVDKIPVFTMGYGMSAGADGTRFPWVFNFPTTYWSQASAFIRYVGAEMGGLQNLRGKKIGLLFLEGGYGREPIPLFKALAKKYGYKYRDWAVPFAASLDQRSQWRKIVRWNPDYLFMWGWGVMNSTAIERAIENGYDLKKFIGVWWSGSEVDVKNAGMRAKGYRAGTFHATGIDFPLHRDILKHVYKGDMSAALKNNFGEVLWNRGMLNALLSVEGIRNAILKYGKTVTGEHVRWGLENVNITNQRLRELGLANYMLPIKVTCADHEGNGPVMFQEWDGRKWVLISDWVQPMRDIVRPMLEAAAVKEAAKWNYQKRSDCN